MLELKNISMQVENHKEILKNINLTIDDAKFVVITGPNGGGKSTLAKVIAGIEHPNEGKIFFNGRDITDMSITERARLGIGFAFQQPVRFKGLTVQDLVELAAGKPMQEMELCHYLRDVGLCARDYIHREVNASLSGGEIKRIEIAMALARKAQLTIFDEPEAGIDLWSFNNLINVFKTLHQQIHGSILIISHQERILDIADEIIVLSAGTVSAHGKRDEILPELLSGGGSCRFCPDLERTNANPVFGKE
ncbi:MAG TPA: ATP-binding cassette domain-containing protein [Firmicutes bacterium]|nr:ATP-binding cassette domain-containing protein [Bacillota bacterium]